MKIQAENSFFHKQQVVISFHVSKNIHIRKIGLSLGSTEFPLFFSLFCYAFVCKHRNDIDKHEKFLVNVFIRCSKMLAIYTYTKPTIYMNSNATLLLCIYAFQIVQHLLLHNRRAFNRTESNEMYR